MRDLATLAGTDYLNVLLDGSTYRVAELRLDEWAQVQAWIKATVPGPLAVLSGPDFDGLPASEQVAIRRLAFEEKRSWPPRVGSRAWFEALDHEGGHAVLLRVLLSRYQPGISPERCAELAERTTLADVLPAVVAGLGIFDPKVSPRPSLQPKARKKAGAQHATTSARSSTSSPKPTAGPRSKPSG